MPTAVYWILKEGAPEERANHTANERGNDGDPAIPPIRAAFAGNG